MNRWQIHLTQESVKHADQLFFSLRFVLFPTEFLEAYVFRNSYICDAPGILGIDMRRPRQLCTPNSFSKILMPQKIKIISSSQFIYSTAIMPKTLAKRKKESGKLTDEAESCKVCLVRSAKLAKPMEVPLVVMPEVALYAHASTASLKVTSTQLLSSTPSSNLSSAFAAKSSAVIMKSPSSVVKRKVACIDFCNSTQVKTECFKYIKNAADLPALFCW